ncbi:MAG: sodium:solute symporter family protein [Bernardetiaceae bacterium]
MTQLIPLDYALIVLFFLISAGIGLFTARRAGSSAGEFFLSGRRMPWWLLGISMVATTFAADTPNLVTEIVRQKGVSGNWLWWAFLLTGMLTVFFYARLWRRSEVLTDLGFYALRYSGREARLLRGFRAVYLGVVFNVLVMATVSVAAIKLGGVLLGLSPLQTLVLTMSITLFYSTLGGLQGILLTDLFQFLVAMGGGIWAAVVIVDLPEVGGLSALLAHPMVSDRLAFVPDFSDRELLMGVLVLPLAVQWWSVWYPGAEPGGGGYVAQRMLAAKSENHALAATLFFNLAHYALRPWPWLLIALASLVVFPDLSALSAALPEVSALGIAAGDDLAYPAMLRFLPNGLLGLVIASLTAAFMSTISTHLNWGASYVVYDYYQPFVHPEADEKRLVWVGRLTTLLTLLLTAGLALLLESALAGFQIILKIGAGTGLIFILRWFWWRINAYTELSGMVISFLVALYFEVFAPLWGLPLPALVWTHLLWEVGITTAGWLLVTFLTRPTDEQVLLRFFRVIRPYAYGWQAVVRRSPELMPYAGTSFGRSLLGMICGVVLVYAVLFGTGYLLYGQALQSLLAWSLAVLSGVVLWERVFSAE